ncbi:MAG: TIGR02757 family protein [Acidobacteriota bacterium]
MRLARLKRRLDGLHRDTKNFDCDPVWFPHQYATAADREVVAFIAAQFAYGNVKQIFRSLRFVMERLTPGPAGFLPGYTARHPMRFRGFCHRFHGPADLRLLLLTVGEVLRQWGSIEAVFADGYRGDLRAAIASFSSKLLGISKSARIRPGKSFGFFFPDPVARGSPCKRLNMFLRWVARDEPPDLGLWKCIDPADLMIPLDTHVARIGRLLGLTSRRSNDWTTAAEITASLRLLDPRDPVKYDFAIAQLGIRRECPHRRDPRLCSACGLRDVCVEWGNLDHPRAVARARRV